MKPALLLALLVAAVGLGPRASAQVSGPAEAAVDSARAEVEAGRHWHATRILRRLAGDGPLHPRELLLLAEAEAGWGNWEAALVILDEAEWIDDLYEGRGRLLRARALEESGRWGEAADGYTAYIALDRGSPSAATRVRRARALDRASREEAMPDLRVLARTEPVAASWLALEMARRASQDGDPDRVRSVLAVVSDPAALSRGWNLEARAHLAASTDQ